MRSKSLCLKWSASTFHERRVEDWLRISPASCVGSFDYIGERTARQRTIARDRTTKFSATAEDDGDAREQKLNRFISTLCSSET